MIICGYSLKRLNLVKAQDIEALNNIAIKLTLPCLVFTTIYTSNLSGLRELILMPWINIITTIIVGILVYYICKLKKYDKKRTWTLILVTCMGNTAFVGYTVCYGVFGQQGLVVGIFSDLGSLISFLCLSAILTVVFEGSAKESMKKIFGFPMLWGLIFGLICNITSFNVGDVITTVTEYLGNATIPIIMISLGVSLNFKGIKENLNFAGFGFLIKLVIYPLVAFLIILSLGLKGLQMDIAIIQAAMPSGMIVLTLIADHKLDLELASVIIFSTTIMSLLTLSILLFLL